MNPVVHHSVDSYTVWLPESEHTLCYNNNHLPHIRCTNILEYTKLLLGDINRYVYTTSVLIQKPPWKSSNGNVSNERVVRYGRV